MADPLKLVELARAAMVEQQNADRARLAVERELAKWRGKVPVREIARETSLSAATISNVFRGRLVVSLVNVDRIAMCLLRRGLK